MLTKITISLVILPADISECASDPCLNGGTCLNDVDGYICSCPESYTGIQCGMISI